MLVIRPATPDDAKAVSRLNTEFNNDPAEYPVTSNEMAEHLTEPPPTETLFVAEMDGVLVGFICLQVVRSVCYRESIAEVTELYESPRFRRKGAAAALLEQAERRARERGAQTVTVRTNQANVSAQALYRKIGYAVEDELVMEKKL